MEEEELVEEEASWYVLCVRVIINFFLHCWKDIRLEWDVIACELSLKRLKSSLRSRIFVTNYAFYPFFKIRI